MLDPQSMTQEEGIIYLSKGCRSTLQFASQTRKPYTVNISLKLD